jgi:hypothetical protein
MTPNEETKMIGSLTYIAARKQSDGSYTLVYRGTSNEVFPGRRWPNAAAARMHARVEQARAAVRAEYATAGLDADVEIDGFDAMNADQLADEITYLGDHQG